MLTEVLKSISVIRLKGILQNRYGKGLKVNFMTDATGIDLTMQTPSIIEGDLRIPIFSHGEFLATAFIERASELSKADQETASALVSMVLEPLIYNWKIQQEGPAFVEIDNQELNNVIPFNEDVYIQTQTKSFLTNVMFLQGQNPHLIPKIATELHALSGRWAFLRFSDIKSQVQSAQDLLAIGDFTLLVDDILNLSPAEQNILTDYLEKLDHTVQPLVLVASSSPLKSLASQQMLSTSLIKQLQKCVVEADRLPLSLPLLRETLELFLEPGQNL